MSGPPAAVAQLLAAGRLEQVPADLATARRRLERAEEKLGVAQQLATIDIEVAYVTAYDSARIALTALMLAEGFRAPARPRAHETVGMYGESVLDAPAVRQFQRMRRRRNKAEYDDIVIGNAELHADLQIVKDIVGAVTADLSTRAS